MAVSRKGKRTIQINEFTYLWWVERCDYSGWKHLRVIREDRFLQATLRFEAPRPEVVLTLRNIDPKGPNYTTNTYLAPDFCTVLATPNGERQAVTPHSVRALILWLCNGIPKPTRQGYRPVEAA